MPQHLRQMFENGFWGHGPQIELKTTRQHRHWHFLRIGGGQYKFQILWRLFQCFQHGVERRVGQHVNLVNHEDFKAALYGLVNSLLQQTLNFVDTAVRCSVQFGVIHESARINVLAGLTHTTRFSGNAPLAIKALAIEGLGQNTRHGGLADATCPCEQIGMVQPLLHQSIREGLHHVLLPHHFSEVARTVFSCQNKIRHVLILSVSYNNPRRAFPHG